MGTDLNRQIETVFGLEQKDIRMYGPLSLAYIGDAIYELVIRSVILETKEQNVNQLHKKTCAYVKASGQCAIFQAMKEQLTEEEMGYFRRGRNAKSYSVPKNCSVTDYRNATGFEALCGYWYLTGQTDRMIALLSDCMKKSEDAQENF